MNSGSDDHTPTISKQGRITTQNPQLLSLLRENSAASVRKLSPPTKSNRTPITSAGRMSAKQKNDKESEIKSAQAVGSNSPVGDAPEHSHGSPLRSRRLSPAVGGDSEGERGHQLEDSLVDSLEVDNRAEVERSNSGADADGRYFLQDSLEPAVLPASPKLASNKAANVSEQLTSDKIFENNDGHRFVDSNNISSNSYSARRLKGTDSSHRILLPTKDTLSSEQIVSRAPSKQSNATPEKDQVSDNFTDTVKLDIRQMLENGMEQIGYVRNNNNNSARRHSAGKREKFHPEAPAMAQDEADRMYVDSPTFTPQEEEEYRFVSSRLEDQEDFKDNATYRELDQNALKGDSDVAYSKTQARKQYVMRPSASSKRPSVDIPGEKHPAQRQPEIPLSAVEDSLEVSTEDSDLERERNYQNALQERLQQQALTDADIHIPRLNLPNESVDFVRHSFEDEDTYRDTEQAEDDFAVQDNGQWVHQPQNPYQYEPQPIHQQYRQPEYSSGMPQPQPPHHYQEHYQQQGYFPPGPQQHQQQHSHQVDYQYGGPQPQNMYGPSEPPYEQYDNVDPNLQQQYPDDQYEYSQEGHDNEGDPQQFYPPQPQLQSGQGLARYPTQTEAEYFIELPTKDDQSPRRDIDYIEKNKQNINRTKQGRSYGDLNKKKSEIAQQHASKLGQTSQRKTPAVNTKRVRNEIQTEDMDQPNGNAEQVWQNRAAHLANKKQGSGKAKSRKVGKLQKYPTESKIKTQVGKNIPDVPDNIARHEANADRGALSTGDLSPSRRPLVLKPITQEVWTEDGQRISVDINLKLMSPPPAPGQQIALGRQNPLGPIPQGGPQLIAHQMAHTSYPRAGAQLQQEQQLDQPYFGQQQATHYQQPIQAYPDTPHQHGFPVQGEFEKFKKHQHNVEQQELMQQQMYQQQLARKQELQQQLQNLQLEEQGYSTDSSVPLYQQQYPDEDMYDGAYPTPQGEDFNMGTPRRSRPAQPGRSGVNPYTRIPPIPAHAHPKESPEGYVNQFHDRKQKEQRRPDYKVYTLNDYRKMQKEVRLGGLGPDLDNETYKDRASKKIRQENYARAVMMKNKQVPQGRPPPNPRPQETDMLPKTYVAREYAKSIPKPKVRPVENEYNSYEVSAQLSPSSTRKNVSSTRNFSGPSTRNNPGPAKLPPTPTKNIDVIDLQKLHERHQRDKQNVALMRQNREIL